MKRRKFLKDATRWLLLSGLVAGVARLASRKRRAQSAECQAQCAECKSLCALRFAFCASKETIE